MPRAPKHCGWRGCMTLTTKGRCPQHDSGWKTSPRTASAKATSSRRWKETRWRILNRDNNTCQIRYDGVCTSRATVVDHIIPVAKRPDLTHTDTNLQAACKACNDFKARKHDR